jgi:hypothetical protein
MDHHKQQQLPNPGESCQIAQGKASGDKVHLKDPENFPSAKIKILVGDPF